MQKYSTVCLSSGSAQEQKKYNGSKYIVLAEYFKVEYDGDIFLFKIRHSMLCTKMIYIGGLAIALNSVK